MPTELSLWDLLRVYGAVGEIRERSLGTPTNPSVRAMRAQASLLTEQFGRFGGIYQCVQNTIDETFEFRSGAYGEEDRIIRGIYWCFTTLQQSLPGFNSNLCLFSLEGDGDPPFFVMSANQVLMIDLSGNETPHWYPLVFVGYPRHEFPDHEFPCDVPVSSFAPMIGVPETKLRWI